MLKLKFYTPKTAKQSKQPVVSVSGKSGLISFRNLPFESSHIRLAQDSESPADWYVMPAEEGQEQAIKLRTMPKSAGLAFSSTDIARTFLRSCNRDEQSRQSFMISLSPVGVDTPAFAIITLRTL